MSNGKFLRDNFQPVLLGSSRSSRQLARALYRKYGLVSYICGAKRAVLSELCPSFMFWRVAGCDFPELLCEQLRYLASFDPYCVYIAVPCDEAHEKFLEKNAAEIDGSYIIRKADAIFADLPALEPIARKKKKIGGDSYAFE